MGGYVCNLAIARYATVSVTRGMPDAQMAEDPDRRIAEAAARRFDIHDAQIEVRSDFPIGAGLGGSSAVGVATVAALAALRGQRLDPAALAELSREIEVSDLGVPGGRQDHYAAAFGGALGLRFGAGRVQVRAIPLEARTRTELERRCLIVYTGQSRISGETIKSVLDAYTRRDSTVVSSLRHMTEIAEVMTESLAAGDVDMLGRLVGQQWKYQRALHPAIPTPLIDEIIDRAMQSGAIGCKALGASGGGCVLVVASHEHVDRVRAEVASHGELLPFTIDERGVERCV
jgi:D-glycero-alpha-D-manno-heptose-7-phosphate kinase